MKVSDFKAIFVAALLAAALAGCNNQPSDQPAANAPTPIANAAPQVTEPVIPTGSATTNPAPQTAGIPIGSGFDFYVLALSWSPSYCQLEGPRADPSQCRAAKPYRFIVHGLWPQDEQGFPSNCDGSHYPSRDDIRSVLDLTPSAGLIRHEWEKHGACSGLSPADYFAVMRAARGRVAIPAQFSGNTLSLAPPAVENAFMRANSGLQAGGMATACDGGLLTEVRICLTKSLEFRTCPEVDRSSCRARSVTIPSIQ